jgi:hypothetical protein
MRMTAVLLILFFNLIADFVAAEDATQPAKNEKSPELTFSDFKKSYERLTNLISLHQNEDEKVILSSEQKNNLDLIIADMVNKYEEKLRSPKIDTLVEKFKTSDLYTQIKHSKDEPAVEIEEKIQDLKLKMVSIKSYVAKYGKWKSFSQQLNKNKLLKMGLSLKQKETWLNTESFGQDSNTRLKIGLKNKWENYNMRLLEMYAQNNTKKVNEKTYWKLNEDIANYILEEKFSAKDFKLTDKPQLVENMENETPPAGLYLKELAFEKKTEVKRSPAMTFNLVELDPPKLKIILKESRKILYQLNSDETFGLNKIPRFKALRQYLKKNLNMELEKKTYTALKNMALTPAYQNISPQNLRLAETFFYNLEQTDKPYSYEQMPFINWYYKRFTLWRKITSIRKNLSKNLTVSR